MFEAFCNFGETGGPVPVDRRGVRRANRNPMLRSTGGSIILPGKGRTRVVEGPEEEAAAMRKNLKLSTKMFLMGVGVVLALGVSSAALPAPSRSTAYSLSVS